MTHLEQSLEAPTAVPKHIVSIISNLASDTVKAPRVLSNALVRRLSDIADMHDGAVPLHGRLFAQWLHHAYPQECSYPYVSGVITPSKPKDWVASGQTISANKTTRKAIVEKAQQKASNVHDGTKFS